MAFDAQQKKINDVLSGDVKYVIPRYQRKYVWQEKQWRELFDDIKYCLDVTNEYEEKGQKNEWTHFLGSLVFERNEKDLIVIDGQQRLTTITLILCSICTLFNELKEESRFRGVTKYIIGTDDMGQDYVRVDNQDLKNFQLIVAASTEYNSLQSKENLFSGVYLTNSPQDNVNIKQCFIFFYTQLKEIITKSENPAIELGNIKDKIMGLDVIDIRASNQQESYNIFEILNARGVDLKQHELIKNYIFKYIHPRANIDTAKITWDSIETNMYINRRSTLDSFFTHYVSHRFAKPSKDNTEFRIVKQFCDRQHMGDFLNDLLNKSSFYRMFYCPDECDNLIIRESLRFFLENNHRQFRPLFLSVISAFKNGKITEKDADYEAFREGLLYVNQSLAKQIAGDGEGCTRLFEVHVAGADSKENAKILSKSVVTSSLTKAAIYGKDANWGRILCALGYAGVDFDPVKVDISLKSADGVIEIVKDGIATDYSEDEATKVLSADAVTADIDVHNGVFEATAWGCDLTHDYVTINADYRS